MISIILPLYNKEKTIEKTIESILNQSYQNFELIIVNDGSTDSSYKVVKNIKSNKIRLFTKKNEGVSATRNFGIKQAKYEIIAFIDGDDIWLPNYLMSLKEMIIKYPNCGMYLQNFKRVNIEKSYNIKILKNKNFEQTDNFEKKYLKWIFTTSSVAIKKQCFSKNNIFDTNLTHGEDLDLWLRIGLQQSVSYNPNITVLYNANSKYNTGRPTNLKSTIFYKIVTNKSLFLKIKSNLQVKKILNLLILYGAVGFFYTKDIINFKFLFKHINPFYLLSIKNGLKYLVLFLYFLLK